MTDYAFLHGGGQGGWIWSETLQAMARQTDGGFGRALALDAPGCGDKRGRSDEDIGNREVAAELVADIEAAGLRDVVLVGHSQAGQILPIMLELRPRLFQRAVYVTCLVPPAGTVGIALFGSGKRGEVEGEIGWPADRTGDPRVFFKTMFCNDMTPAFAESFLDKLGRDAWPARTMTDPVGSYDHLGVVPATYVVCLQDESLPPKWQESFARNARSERIVSIDAGHQVMNTRPHTLAEVLLHEAR